MVLLFALSLLAAPNVARETVSIGDRQVQLLVHDAGAGPLLVNVHDDENTAVEAALAVIAHRGGRVLELQHTGARLISFHLEGRSYTVDPNRIFTAKGVPATLRKFGATSTSAESAVTAFASALLAKFQAPAGWPLIALHNNTPDLSYSAQSYVSGADSGEAAEVFLAKDKNPNDFFLVTQRAHFEALKSRGFNVVLQKSKPATDDGSLSVYCAQHQFGYVNVEAQHGHLSEQTAMIDALFEVLAPK